MNDIISGFAHSFDTGIAKAVGVSAAIVFNHIVYWLRINARRDDSSFHDGKYWMFESQKKMSEFFEYFSEDEVFKAIKKLLDSGLLIKGNFNKNSFDRTAWYTVSNQELIVEKNRIQEKITIPSNDGIDACNLNSKKDYDTVKRRNGKRHLTECIYTIEKEEYNNPPLSSPQKKSNLQKDNTLEEEDFLPFDFLNDTTLSPSQKKRLSKEFPREDVEKALKIAKTQTIKKSLMSLLVNILTNPDKWSDKPEDQPLTPQQQKALEYNAHLVEISPLLAKKNKKLFKENSIYVIFNGRIMQLSFKAFDFLSDIDLALKEIASIKPNANASNSNSKAPPSH